jgi:hypothetical protein
MSSYALEGSAPNEGLPLLIRDIGISMPDGHGDLVVEISVVMILLLKS